MLFRSLSSAFNFSSSSTYRSPSSNNRFITTNSSSSIFTAIRFFYESNENQKSSERQLPHFAASVSTVPAKLTSFYLPDASSIRTTPRGNFVVSHLSSKYEFPWLSVPQVDVAVPTASPCSSSVGTKTISPTSAPRSSREAIVRNASPRAKAHGAFRRLRRTANHSASSVLVAPRHRHPPIATSSPSALASTQTLQSQEKVELVQVI